MFKQLVSEDSRLRQTIRKTALKESQEFMDSIGSAEMEQEIQRRVLRFSRRTKALMEDTHLLRMRILNGTLMRY